MGFRCFHRGAFRDCLFAVLVYIVLFAPLAAYAKDSERSQQTQQHIQLQGPDDLKHIETQVFEVHKDGELIDRYSFHDRYGRLTQEFFGISVSSLDQLQPRIQVDNEGNHQLAIVYQGEGRILNFRGSQLNIPAKHPLLSATSDWNNIFALDKTGQLFAVDKNSLKYQFGKEPAKILPVMKWHLPEEMSEFELRILDGPASLQGLDVAENLQDTEWKNGDVLLVGKDPSGTFQVIHRQSRANILRALFVQSFQVAVLFSKFNQSGHERLEMLAEDFMRFWDEIDDYVEGNQEWIQEDELSDDLRRVLSSFDGKMTIDELEAIKAQIESSKYARTSSVSELLEHREIQMSSLARKVLEDFLKNEASPQSILASRLDDFNRLLQTASAPYNHNQEQLNQLKRALADPQASLKSLQQALQETDPRSLEYWIEASTLNQEEKASVQGFIFFLISQDEALGHSTMSEQFVMSALLELEAGLRGYLERHSDRDDLEAHRGILQEIEKIRSSHSQAAFKKTLNKLQTRLQDQPTFSTLDLLVATQDGDAQTKAYIEEAQLLHPKMQSLRTKLGKHPATKQIHRFVKTWFDVPNLLMAGGFGLVATAWLGTGESSSLITNFFSKLSEAVPVLEQQSYLPQLLISWGFMFGLLNSIMVVLRVSAKRFSEGKGIGYFAQKLGKNVSAWVAFPFVAGLFRLSGQRNMLHAAEHGLWPNPQTGAVHLPDWLVRGTEDYVPQSLRESRLGQMTRRGLQRLGFREHEEARQRLATAARAQDFRLSVTRNIALQETLQMLGDEIGLHFEAQSWEAMMKEYFQHKRSAFAKINKENIEAMREAIASRNPEVIAETQREVKERSIAITQRYENFETKFKELSQIVAYEVASSENLKPVNFERLQLSAPDKELIQNLAKQSLRRHRNDSKLENWLQRLKSKTGFAILFQSAQMMNYPLGLFENLRRATPRPDVGANILNQYRADIVTQYLVGGLVSGWPFQDLLSDMGYTFRAVPEAPNELYAQPHAVVRDESGEVIGFDESESAPWYLMNTHPNEVAALMEQHTLILTFEMAMSITEVGASSGFEDPYQLVELRESEREEPFMRSLFGFFRSAAHLREAGYADFLNARLKNIFLMAQPMGLVLGFYRMLIAGLSFPAAFGQFIFVSGWKFPAYYWPWMVLKRGFGHRALYLQKEYTRFSITRNLLRRHLENENLRAARLAGHALMEVYEHHHQKLPVINELQHKTIDTWSENDLAELLEQADEKPAVYQEYNDRLNQTANLSFGAVLTTILGIGFIATSLNIVSFSFAFTWGALGLLVFPALTSLISLYDKMMQKTGDPALRAWKATKHEMRMRQHPESSLSAQLEAEREAQLLEVQRSSTDEITRQEQRAKINDSYDKQFEILKAELEKHAPPPSKLQQIKKGCAAAIRAITGAKPQAQ